MSSVAFLVYDPKHKAAARRSTTFDVLTNAGAYVIIDTLQRAGIDVGFCAPETAHEHDVVLVSMTSTYDTYNLIAAVGRLKTWRERRFTAIVGGFGCQNIYPIRHYVDYAVFGRAEGFVVDLVRAALERRDYQHESVMHVPSGVRPVIIAQTDGLYPHRLTTQPPFAESEIGCPRRCYFCHYTWARRYLSQHDGRFQGNMNLASREVFLDHIGDHTTLKGKVRTALDGMSERLRLAFNKPLTDERVKEAIERASLAWQGSILWIDLYNIGSYPTETQADIDAMYDLFRCIEPQGKRVLVTMHVSPFRPSPATPGAWLPANINFDWSRYSITNIVRKPLLEAFFTQSLEGPYSHLMSMVVERATEESDALINTMVFSSGLAKLGSKDKVRALQAKFDLSQYLREYSVDELLPTWYLESYTPNDRLKLIAQKLKDDLHK